MKYNMIRKIYRQKDLNKIQSKIDMLGDVKIDEVRFIDYQLLTTLIAFIIALYATDLAYIFAPAIALAWYYLFYYFIIQNPLKKRTQKLDHEALYFFEILTLTLESGRNLESSIETTVSHVDSEISSEFKRELIEVKFLKSLL